MDINSIQGITIYKKVDKLEIEAFLHCNDLSYTKNGEEELKNYKKGDKLKVKVLDHYNSTEVQEIVKSFDNEVSVKTIRKITPYEK